MSESRWSYYLVWAVAVVAIAGLVIVGLMPSLGHPPHTLYNANSKNNLKQLGLAFHNYLFANGSFPAQSIRSADGRPLLSWRVAILPCFEDDGAAASLYKKFNLEEPWDSEHNRALIAEMAEVFRFPGQPNNGETRYLAVVGPNTVLGQGNGLSSEEITDGLSNTIMIVESDYAVLWTEPDDLDYTPERPLLSLGHAHENGFNVLMCDGCARFLLDRIDKNTLRGLMTADGGEDVTVP